MPTVAQLDIQVDADIASAEAKLATIDALINGLSGGDVDIDVGADTAEAVAELAAVEAAFEALAADTAHLEVDADTGAARINIAALAAEVDQLTHESNRLIIDAETALAIAAVEALQAQVDAIRDGEVVLDVDKAQASAAIKELEAELARLRNKDIDINTRVGINRALLELQMLRAQVRSLDGTTIDIDVDVHGDWAVARREIDRLWRQAAEASRNLDRTVRLIIGLAPLIAPALVAAAGGLGVLSAGFLAAGAGVITFGAVAVGVFKPVIEGLNKITQAQQAATLAVTDEQREAALKREKAAWDSLTESQVKMVRGILQFQDAWATFVHQFEPAIFDLASRGLSRMASLLPRLTPIVQSMATAFDDLGTRLSAALDTPRYQGFFDFVARQAGPTFNAWVTAIGNVIEGLFSLAEAFEPLLVDFNKGLVDMTRRFAEWAAGLKDNPAFQEFVDNVRRYTPVVLHFLGVAVEALWAFVDALAKIGAKVLPILSDILEAFTAFETAHPGLTAAAAAILGFLGVLVGAAGPLRVFWDTAKLVAGAIRAISTALLGASAGPVGLVVAGLVALAAAAVWAYQNIEPFRQAVDRAWEKLKEFAAVVWPQLQAAWQALVSWFQANIGPALQTVVNFVLAEWNKMVTWAQTNAPLFAAAWQQIVAIVTAALNQIQAVFLTFWPAIQAIWAQLWPALVMIVQGAWTVISGVISGALEVIRGALMIFAALLTGDWHALWEGIKTYLSGVWTAINAIVQGGLLILVGILGAAGALVVGAFRLMFAAILASVQTQMNLVVAAVTGAMTRLQAALGAQLAAAYAVWVAGWTRFATWVTVIGFRISNAVQGFLARVVASVRAQLAAAAATWTAGWSRMAATVSSIGARISASVRAFLANVVAAVRAQLAAAAATWTAGWNQMVARVQSAGSRIASTVRSFMSQAASAIRSQLAAAAATWTAGWNRMVAAAQAAGARAVAAARSTVSQIVSVVAGLAGQLYSAGYNAFSNFADGVAAAGARAVAAAQSVVARVAALMPGSPAETGPLSGRGYVKLRGERFAQDLAAGIRSQQSLIAAAMGEVAGLMALNVTPTVPAAATATTRGGADLNRLITILEDKFAGGATTQFNFTTHNPQAEPTSITVNRTLQKAAALGLTG